MAEEDLASQEAAAEGAQEALEGQEDDTPEPIANLARDLGWTPREEWQGEAEKWKPAEQFIRDGRDIQQSTSRELRGLREQMERFAGVTEQIVTDKVAERDAYWKTQFNQAVEDGDTEKANTLLEQRPAAQPANGKAPVETPETVSWKAKNPWFGTDPLASIRAEEICNRLATLPVPEQLAQVDRAIRKEFPELFPKAKQPPGVQTGQQRNANPSNRAKGFADMPADSQAIALDFEKRLGVPKEATAKKYWEDIAKEGVRR